MQVELFATAPAPQQRSKSTKKIVEHKVLGTFNLETWVSWPAKAVNATDGLRIEFSIPTHSLLIEAGVDPAKRDMVCKYRVRAGLKWGGMGRKADIKIEADLCEGVRGGLYLHCRTIEIIQPVSIRSSMSAKPSKAQLKKWEKAAISANP